jgi:hypothetical protein
MARFNFSRIGEPPALYRQLRVLENARLKEAATAYLVPDDVQTLDYARAVLRHGGEPAELADLRAENRVNRGRRLAQAGALGRIITTTAGLQNQLVVGDDLRILHDQHKHLITLVEEGLHPTFRGPQIGIVPVLPAEMPADMLGISSRDVASIDTDQGVFMTGPDGWDVVPLGARDRRRAELARQRDLQLGEWAASAVYNEDALYELEASLSTLRTA